MPKCRICGCTFERACPAGCGWAGEKKPHPDGPICTVCILFRVELAQYLDQANRVTVASLERLFSEAKSLP